MSQIARKDLNTTWVEVTECSGTDNVYFIQNVGNTKICLIEADSAPADNTNGLIVTIYNNAKYKVSSHKLYARTVTGNGLVNISKKE